MCVPMLVNKTNSDRHKVATMTVSTSVLDVAAEKLQILKCECFTHLFDLAAQKIYITTIF